MIFLFFMFNDVSFNVEMDKVYSPEGILEKSTSGLLDKNSSVSVWLLVLFFKDSMQLKSVVLLLSLDSITTGSVTLRLASMTSSLEF